MGDPSLVTIDIETCRVQDAHRKQGILEAVRDEVTKTHAAARDKIVRRYKRDETIARKLDELGEPGENVAKLQDEFLAKTALNAGLGEIFCIGYAIGDAPAQCLYRRDLGGIVAHPPCAGSVGYESEGEMLEAFNRLFDAEGTATPLLAGHNIEFDLRFIFQRCAILEIKCAHQINSAVLWRYPKNVFDTMQTWAGFGQRVSLSALAGYLGIDAKEGMTGDLVPAAIEGGNGGRVVEYCIDDVDATRKVARRLGA